MAGPMAAFKWQPTVSEVTSAPAGQDKPSLQAGLLACVRRFSFPHFLNCEIVPRCTGRGECTSPPSGVHSFKFDVTSSRRFGRCPTHPSFIELYTHMGFLLWGIGLVFTNVGLAHAFFHLILYTHLSLFTYTALLFSSFQAESRLAAKGVLARGKSVTRQQAR